MPRVIHFDIACDDVHRAKRFYGDTFGWTFQQWSQEPPYLLAMTGENEPGIDGGLGPRLRPDDSVLNSIGVPDVDEYAKKVVAAGGKLTSPKTPMTGVGWLYWCEDTEGNAFGLYQEDRSVK